MLHQMQQGAKPFKRPKVTKPSMTSTFEQELHNILGVPTKDNIQEQPQHATTNTSSMGENYEMTGIKLGAVLPGTTLDKRLRELGIEKDKQFDYSDEFHGIRYNVITVKEMLGQDIYLEGSDLERFFAGKDTDSYFDLVVQLSASPANDGLIVSFKDIIKGLVDYKSPFSSLRTIFDRGGDVNQFIRVFYLLFSDFCMSLSIMMPSISLNKESKDLLSELSATSSFAGTFLKGSVSPQQILTNRMTDLLLLMFATFYMSIQASLTERLPKEDKPQGIAVNREEFQSIAEKEFQNSLLQVSLEYTSKLSDLKNGLSRLKEITLEDEKELAEQRDTIINSIREVALEPITKSKQQLDIIAQLKKDLAVKTLEVKKLTKQLGNGTGGGGGGAYSSQGSTSLSKEEQLLNKKTFDLLLPLKIREVFMKYPAYRYGLTLAGKIHLRNEQSIFVTDITQLVYIQHESNPLSSTIPKIDESYVKIQVEQARTRYLSFLHSTPVTDIVVECMQLLTPTMVSVLQTCLNETKKLVELETNRRITAEELLCPKGGNTASEGLYDKFTSWVAAVYISDQQIQKNIATTQSDKNAQNLSRLKTILDLRQGLIDMGYRVKPNPYSMA